MHYNLYTSYTNYDIFNKIYLPNYNFLRTNVRLEFSPVKIRKIGRYWSFMKFKKF